jgi:hypothetical protein
MTSRLAAILSAALLALLFATSAQASIQVESFTTTSSDSQAGGHPDLTTDFKLGEPGVHESAREVVFNAPTGLFGNPNAVTRCTAEDFAFQQCPVNAQAGLVTIRANINGEPEHLLGTAPLFDMVPQAGETARFSFIVPELEIPIAIPVSVRTASDYGLRFAVSEISQLTPLSSAHMVFWAMPAAKVHDAQRFPKGSPGHPAGCEGVEGTGCITEERSASIPTKPLIDYPTTCPGQPLATELRVRSYEAPDEVSTAKSEYPPATGCDHEIFNPVLAASLTTGETDSASGLNLNFTVPQTLGTTPSPSEAKSVVVTLPPGLTINPDAADGQSACSDLQANFGTDGPTGCPDQSKIGTVSIGTPALDGPLTGSLYIGEPKPGDQYRVFMTVSGFGMNAKLVGSFRPDPQTGQLTALFENLPQVPFEEFDLHLFASDRGLMATPTTCDLYPIQATFVPWNDTLAPQTSQQFFSLEAAPAGALCPGLTRPFKPRLEAGTSIPQAGAFSDFHLKLDRDDGDQFLGDLNFKMPRGFTGDLRGVGYCPEASIAAAATNSGTAEKLRPSCPPSSLIGTTNVAAGPGSHPFHAVGSVYMAGPFKGAPLSLVAVTPALAGPYDYGVVVVRVALHIDPQTAQVSAVSDTVPSIIGGIPIRMRSIQVNIDRRDAAGKPNFTINPTSCEPLSVDSEGIGDQGTVASFSSYFHAVNCTTLPFKPGMTFRQLGRRKSTNRGANPTLQIDLKARKGDANIKSLSVTLPSAFEIDQEHLGNICTEKELAATQCAGRQQIGKATDATPQLDQPLSGPVYAVSGAGGLPRLAFILNGQVDLVPRAESVTIKGGRLKTTVPVVPDAEVGHFMLRIFGGKHGYLANTRQLCGGHRPKIAVAYEGQNGSSRSQKVALKAPCGGAKHRAKHSR